VTIRGKYRTRRARVLREQTTKSQGLSLAAAGDENVQANLRTVHQK